MRIFENFNIGEDSFVEAIAQIQEDIIFVYSQTGRYSGDYETNLTVGVAREEGLFDTSHDYGEIDPITQTAPYEPIPDETIMIFDYFLPDRQNIILEVYNRTSTDFNEAQTNADFRSEFDHLPEIVDLIEFSPNGFTNQTLIIYTVLNEHEAYVEWRKTLTDRQIVKAFTSFNWDFRNYMMPWISENRQKQSEEPNSEYAIHPTSWSDFIGK